MHEVIVLDFGGQYSHLIARRVRELGVYAEIKSPNISPEELKEVEELEGIILSGGAASVYDQTSPSCNKKILDLDCPILGICYGHQLLASLTGGEVKTAESGEYGTTKLETTSKSKLLQGWKGGGGEEVWMNHKDRVVSMPDSFSLLAATDNSPVAAFANENRQLYGVQFHPEVTHTDQGSKILKNFVLDICQAQQEWDASHLADDLVQEAKKRVGDRKAIIGLSGGVDSSTAATIMSRAIGDNLTAVYVDTGLMRHQETKFMRETFADHELDLRIVDKKQEFFDILSGVKDPEQKRKLIGNKFIEVFESVAKEEAAEVLVQGTIYSDRIESGSTTHSDTIKSHHNVGGLPEKMNLEVYEPLRNLYKDEVRDIARRLGLPDKIVQRHVFPGPGLAIRIVGEVTREKTSIVRQASHIITTELKKEGLYHQVWMAFAVLLSLRNVGIAGDARSYSYPIVIRIVESEDAMTANFAKIPYELLEKMSTRITNEIDQVNRVVYDVSNKPPATMEWE